MRSAHTHLDLDCSHDRAWEVLIDLPRWHEWNTVIPSIRGDVRLGGSIEFRIELPSLRPLSFRTRVTVLDPGRAFAWGKSIPGIVGGEHHFRLLPLEGGRARFTHGEDFFGVLPHLFLRDTVLARIEAGFRLMNEQLRARVEGR